MLFNSYIFIFVFLPVALGVYYGLNHWKQYKAAMAALAALSVVFYGYNNPGYALILLGSVVVNYVLHTVLLKENQAVFQKTCLIFGILFNLGLLGYFKYLGFFIKNIKINFSL